MNGDKNPLQFIMINPLANPKGVVRECELCGRDARIQCLHCKVTYYCDKEHQQLDWRGIHERICPLVSPVRAVLTSLGSEEERIYHRHQTMQRKHHLFEMAKMAARKWLFESQFDLAIPAALQALRYTIDLHGKDAIDVVPNYLLLGEASIGLKQFKQAEDYLSLAKWAVVKTPRCRLSIRAQLERNFGLLYLAQNDYAEALKHLAENVYFLSLLYGPDDIGVSGGCYLLAKVFDTQGHLEKSKGAYTRILEIWSAHFSATEKALDEAQVAEAAQMLTAVQAFFAGSETSILASYLLARVHYLSGMRDKARELMQLVMKSVGGGANHPLRESFERFQTILSHA